MATAEQFSELEEERPFIITGDQAVDDAVKILREGVSQLRRGNPAAALQLFEQVYKGDGPKVASGLSYYGLCLSLVEGQHREGIALCERAIEERSADPAHYANLVEILANAGRRRRAVKLLEESLEKFPWNRHLKQVREKIGYRHTPVIPFLSRDMFLNQILGRMKYGSKKQEED